ncbi:MAG: ABC transporter ATP-binding protein [Aggregatilineales bacterium]
MTAIIQTKNLTRIYQLDGEDINAVNAVTLDIPREKMTAIVGRSGSGKTTLLNLISGLDVPTNGEIWFDNDRLDTMSEQDKRLLRLNKIGFVFQSFGLLPLLDASENVGVPLRMRYMDQQERNSRVNEALDWVGLTQRVHHRPYELSGGEQQRVAIARALASRPQIIMADEPTGQLDTHTGYTIIALLRRLVNEQNITALIITHDPKVMQEADLVYHMSDGNLVESVWNTSNG